MTREAAAAMYQKIYDDAYDLPAAVSSRNETDASIDIWEPWVPAVGDRVQVRLNGECRLLFGCALNHNDGPLVSLNGGPRIGHDDIEHGAIGTVLRILGTYFQGRATRIDEHGHRFCVVFDAPRGPWWGSTYAAVELEPIEGPG